MEHTMSHRSLIRVIRLGLVNFQRNGWLSIASTIVMTITIFIIGVFITQSAVISNTVAGIEEKLDLSIYFEDEVVEDDILKIRETLANRADVKSVEYISKEKALAIWRERPTNEKIKGLVSEEDNPLPRSLSVIANSPDRLSKIADLFSADEYKDSVRRVSYTDNAGAIENLVSSSAAVKRNGFVLSGIFILLSFILIFNTTKIIILSRKDEIEIMRLVGSTESFVRLPFLIEAILFGTFGVLLALPALYLFLKYDLASSNPLLSITKFLAPDMLDYFLSNLIWISPLLLLVGISLSVSMSYFAVRKYVRV